MRCAALLRIQQLVAMSSTRVRAVATAAESIEGEVNIVGGYWPWNCAHTNTLTLTICSHLYRSPTRSSAQSGTELLQQSTWTAAVQQQ
jgi:hypothetical protein